MRVLRRSSAFLFFALAACGSATPPTTEALLPIASTAPTASAFASTTGVPPTDGESGAGPLVALTTERPLVYHPTMLPPGMELCAATSQRPISGDEFCHPADASLWIEVTYLSAGPAAGRPVDAAEELHVISESPPTVGLVVEGEGYKLAAGGMDLDRLLEIAGSIPLLDLTSFDPARLDEPPLLNPIDSTLLGAVLGRNPAEISVADEGHFIAVTITDMRMFTSQYDPAEEETLRPVALRLVQASLISDGRPMVSGRIDTGFANRYAVTWVQRGRWWTVQTDESREVVESRAAAIEAAIAELP